MEGSTLMYRGLSVAVVVPAWNEERLIARTLSAMPDLVDHVIVIDDASTDATAERVRKVADPRVTLIQHEHNTGVGGAIVDGHRQVLHGEWDVSVVMAGDAQMDPDYLPSLLDPIADGAALFTKANRFFARDSLRSMPRHRVVGNVVLSVMTKFSSGYYHLFDPQNGYTAVHREALRRLPLDEIRRGYSFENSMLIHLNVQRVPARDIPIPAVYGDEVSGMRLSRVVPSLLRTLWTGFWLRIWRKYVFPSLAPFALLFFGGLLLTGFGLAAALTITVLAINDITATPATVMLSIAPLLTGVQLLSQALLLDIQESKDL